MIQLWWCCKYPNITKFTFFTKWSILTNHEITMQQHEITQSQHDINMNTTWDHDINILENHDFMTSRDHHNPLDPWLNRHLNPLDPWLNPLDPWLDPLDPWLDRWHWPCTIIGSVWSCYYLVVVHHDMVYYISKEDVHPPTIVLVHRYHAMLMLFFFIMPGVLSGLGNLLVPIQLCVPEMMFPKVNNLGST